MTNENPNGPEVQSQVATDQPGGNPSNLDDPSRVRVGFPSGAVEALRKNRDESKDREALFVTNWTEDLDAVLAWIDRYVPRAISTDEGHEILVGGVGILTIDSREPFADSVELIRLNGRAFVPETPAIVEDEDGSGVVADLLSAIRSAVGELSAMGHSCGNSLRALSTLRAALPDPVICDACNGSGEGVADTICGKCGGSGGIPLEAITSPGVAAGFAGRSRSSGRGGKSATLLGGAE